MPTAFDVYIARRLKVTRLNDIALLNKSSQIYDLRGVTCNMGKLGQLSLPSLIIIIIIVTRSDQP